MRTPKPIVDAHRKIIIYAMLFRKQLNTECKLKDLSKTIKSLEQQGYYCFGWSFKSPRSSNDYKVRIL